MKATGWAIALLACALLPAGAGPAAAQEVSVDEGRRFVEQNCVRCHALHEGEQSPLPQAPALGTLGQRYPVEFLAEAFAEGIVTGHDDMPQFTLEPARIESLIAYLKSLQTP